jgi:transcription initiation factor TFIIIB Brf1 subunit/transcription initiation factor TFIIB
LLAAAVYIACREMGTSRTLKDIAAATNLKLKNVARYYSGSGNGIDMTNGFSHLYWK